MKNTLKLTLLILISLFIVFAFNGYQNAQFRLQQFYGLTKADPLFYDPELNIEELQDELSELKSTENLIRGLIKLNEKLYALEHLELLGPLQKATDTFLKTPTILKAQNLIALQKEFVRLYKKEALHHGEMLEKFFKKDTNSLWNNRIRFFGSATTPAIIHSDLALIVKNAIELEKVITSRENCLLKNECDLKMPSHMPATPDMDIKKFEIPGDIELLQPDILATNRYDKYRGPYASETGCFGYNQDGRPLTQIFYVFERIENGKRIVFPKIATENYYQNLQTSKDTWPFIKYLLNDGINYDLQVDSNDYRCTDLTYWPKLLEIDRQATGQKPNKSLLANLPTILRSIPTTDFLLYRAKITGTLSEPYLYAVGNAYSIMYLTFSPAVWKIEAKPRFLDGKSYPLPSEYSTYHDLKNLDVSDEKIKKYSYRPLPVLKEFIESDSCDQLEFCSWQKYFFLPGF